MSMFSTSVLTYAAEGGIIEGFLRPMKAVPGRFTKAAVESPSAKAAPYNFVNKI